MAFIFSKATCNPQIQTSPWLTALGFFVKYIISKETRMKLIAAMILGLSVVSANAAEPAKKQEPNKAEVRKPKSASINCKDAANAEKTECKKQSKEMPKVDKPATDKK